MSTTPFLPTAFADVNKLLGGGFVRGGLCEVFGDAGAGKTALALSVAARQPRAVYLDLMGSLAPWLVSAWGAEQMHWIEGPIGEGEGRDILDKVLGASELIVLDDVAGWGGPAIGRMAGWLMERLAGGPCVLMVNYVTGVGTPPGDRSMAFYAHQRLEWRLLEATSEGLTVGARTIKNVAAPPFGRCRVTLSFEEMACHAKV